jgi:hypothetical protein
MVIYFIITKTSQSDRRSFFYQQRHELFETEFENILGYYQRPRNHWFMKKTRGRSKIPWACLFNTQDSVFVSHEIYQYVYHPYGSVDSKNANLLTTCPSKSHIEKTILKFVQVAKTLGHLISQKTAQKIKQKTYSTK